MDNSVSRFTYYEVPEDEVVIWRYLDLAKFVSLLKEKSLFMTRADKFEDKFEGAVALSRDESGYNNALADYYCNVAGNSSGVDGFLYGYHKAVRLLRKNSYLNCWCEGEHESLAMWRLYASGTEPKGVAIKSTVGRLKKAIGREVEIGRVKYIDYTQDWPDANEALWRKRLSFEYEHEIRVIIVPSGGLSENPLPFMTLPINLDELIESVYISPMAEPWFKDLVEDVMKKYGVIKGVYHSGMDDEALY